MTGPDAPDAPDAPSGQDGRVAYRWVAMGVVLIGTFMVVLDTTVVNLGLPAMQRDFRTVEGVEWVVTAYLAAVAVAQMASGWVADRLGRKTAFLACLGVFTVGSALCAAAPGLELLVVARVVQGVGGGMLMPVAMAMIYELFEPSERGRALGIFGIAVMAAPAVGPVLGGALVDTIGWRSIFLINIPIGLVALPLSARALRDTGFRESRPFDRLGLLLTTGGLSAFLVGVSLGGTEGWGRPGVWVTVSVGVTLLIAFTLHALRTDHPLVDMRILANPVFAVGMVSLGLLAVAQYARLVYIPLQLGAARDVPEFRIGLVMLPGALGIAATMPLGGRLADRVGARLPVTLGLSVMAATYWPLAHLDTDTPLPLISAVLFVGGLGAGLAMMAPSIVAMNAVSARQLSQASGLSSVTRQLGAAVGLGILAAVFASIRPGPGAAGTQAEIDAYNTIFLIALGVLVVSLVVARFLPGRRVALELQDARRREAAQTDAALAAGIEA